jgi:hypothetical protein
MQGSSIFDTFIWPTIIGNKGAENYPAYRVVYALGKIRTNPTYYTTLPVAK